MKRDGKWVLPLTFLIAAIIIGAFTYHYIEGWKILDSFYFVIITMTTVGYGDFYPVTEIGKIFTMIFSIIGVGSALYFFSLAGSSIFKKHVDEKVSQLKSDVRKEEKVKEDIKKEVRKASSPKKKSRGKKK